MLDFPSKYCIGLEIKGVIFLLLISVILGDIAEIKNEDTVILISGNQLIPNVELDSKYVSESEDHEAQSFNQESTSSGDGKVLEVGISEEPVSTQEENSKFIEEKLPDVTVEAINLSENLESQGVGPDVIDQNTTKPNEEIHPPVAEDLGVPLAEEMTPNALHVNTSAMESFNTTESNITKANITIQAKKATCMELEDPGMFGNVKIVNATTLQKLLINNPNITSRSTAAKCYLIYFFSPYCPFSTQGSAYVNGLARSLPNIPVFGFDSIAYHSLNARYGIMGTPSLVLFHNGNVAGRYNASEFSTFYLDAFIHHFTDQKITSINVTSNDFKANLPSQMLPSPPYALYCAWMFLLTCGAYAFLNSEFYDTLTEAFVNNWREAEAQHEHDD